MVDDSGARDESRLPPPSLSLSAWSFIMAVYRETVLVVSVQTSDPCSCSDPLSSDNWKIGTPYSWSSWIVNSAQLEMICPGHVYRSCGPYIS